MEEMKKVEVEEVIEELGDEPQDIDTTDWKAEALKARGIAKRYQTKLEKSKVEKIVEPLKRVETEPVKEEGFNYAELAYLTTKGVADEDIPFVEETVKRTGKSLKDLLATDWFKKDLKEQSDLRISKNAIPSGSKRSTTQARDEVEYWVQKGELPPESQPELRRKVLNAQLAIEERKSKFTGQSVIIGGSQG